MDLTGGRGVRSAAGRMAGAAAPRTRPTLLRPYAALAELRALAGGRADLLAQVAGIFEGTSEGEPDEPLARSAARLCRMAGADADAIPGWIEEGRRRST